MSVSHDTLRAFERARWARQADVLQAWLATLSRVPPRGDALRQSFDGADVPNAAKAQMHFDLMRDLQRLRLALEGATPSAVDPTRVYASVEAFARDEAVHTLDNAQVFLRKAGGAETLAQCGAAIHRAQRWLQRLRWELVDTGIATEIPLTLSEDIAGAELPAALELTLRMQTTLEGIRDLFGDHH